MKKLISILLAICILLTFVACGSKPAANTDSEKQETVEKEDVVLNDEDIDEDEEKDEEDNKDKEDKPSEKPVDKTEEKPATKPADKTEEKPATKPANKEEEKPATKPADKNEEKPAEKPVEKPVEKPAETPKTLGHTLLVDFKAKASSGMSALQIAESLMTNEVIKFAGGAMAVEEGLLSGFDNFEVTGFKSGASFAPMIGSIPFMGYVFELNDASEVPAFISKLRENANLNWNICSTADEMITGSSGNKVFFVMCPTSLE